MQDGQDLVPEPGFEGMREVGGHATPRIGEVLARYMAVAYLEDGEIKRSICYALTQEGGAEAAVAIMRRRGHATRDSAVAVPRQIAEDLAGGLSAAEVASRPYRYIYERWFYADPDAVPKENPHWTMMPLALRPPGPEGDPAAEAPAFESIFETARAGFAPSPSECFSQG